ncbi:MAG: dockerin type I repeat-containing protein, partial [Oscillospiraceae bacterium]|nr:dockerin type I repeat-containing protein [Oscillospiraceae bacterium]
VGSTVTVSKAGNLINISSQRGGSVTDNKINVLYTNGSGSYMFTQITLSPVEYEPIPCSHNYVLSEDKSVAPTCTEGGSSYYVCSYCNENKTEELAPAGHSDKVTSVAPTCTAEGYVLTECENCDRAETVVISATGHSFEGGVCSKCFEPDPDFEPVYSTGDLNGDGQINAMDVNIIRRFLSGMATPGQNQYEAADVNGDTKVNNTDANLLTRILSGKG